jgi:hypothetical protein
LKKEIELKKLCNGAFYQVLAENLSSIGQTPDLLGWLWKPTNRSTLRTFLLNPAHPLTLPQLQEAMMLLGPRGKVQAAIEISADDGTVYSPIKPLKVLGPKDFKKLELPPKRRALTDVYMNGKPLSKLEIIFLGPEENMRCFYFLRGTVKDTGEEIETLYVKGSV